MTKSSSISSSTDPAKNQIPNTNPSNTPMKKFSKAKQAEPDFHFGRIQDRINFLRPQSATPPKKPFFQRVKNKVSEDLKNVKKYLTAIKDFDKEYLSKTTVGYFKKTWQRVRKLGKLIAHELSKLMRSLGQFKNDVKFGVQASKTKTKYQKKSIQARRKIQQVKADVFKFIPFSVFIIIPGLQLLLPAWLVIFPNAIPSQFMSEQARENKFKKRLESRLISAKKLLTRVPKYLDKLINDPQVPKEDIQEIKKLRKFLGQKEILPTDLLRFRTTFYKYLVFKNFDPRTLKIFSNFMGLQPVTGLYLINNILKLFKTHISVDSPYVSWMTKRLITREIKMYFRKLRREDILISYQDLKKIKQDQIDFLCLERGIQVIGRDKVQKIKDLQIWLEISNLNNVPDLLLLIAMMVDFAEDTFVLKEDEQSDDDLVIVKKYENEIYVKEQLTSFEKAFGIEKLEDLQAQLLKRQKDMMLSKKKSQVLDDDEIEYIFQILEEFQDRHQLSIEECQETYVKGFMFLDFLEKQLIFEMLLQCRNEELQKRRPDLADKARKMIGSQFYYACQVQDDWRQNADKIYQKIDQLNDNTVEFKNKNLMKLKQTTKLGSIKKSLLDIYFDQVELSEQSDKQEGEGQKNAGDNLIQQQKVQEDCKKEKNQ